MMRARLVCLLLVLCLVNSLTHAYHALSKSSYPSDETPNPVRIGIEPKSITIETNSGLRFKAIAFDNRGHVIENALFTWKLENSDLGRISLNGEFFSGKIVTQGKVFACINDSCGSADIKVVLEEPKINVSKTVIDFGEAEWGIEKSINVVVTNDSATHAFIDVSNPGSDFWFTANIKSQRPIRKGDKFCYIKVDLNFKKLEKRCEKQSSFDIRWFYADSTGKRVGDGKLTIPVKVKVIPPKCAKTAPTILSYGNVSRGQKKTMSFAVVFASQKNVKGSFVLDAPWLSITPKEFTTVYENLPADKVKLTIDTKKLPKGKLHTAYVIVKSDACEDVKLDVRVETEEKVTAKIFIGKNEGIINGNKVTFAHPPIVKNNKTYLTPEIFEKIFFTQTKIEGNKVEIIWQSKKILGKVVTINGVQYADLSIRYFTETIGASVSYSANEKSITFVWTPE